MVGPRDRQMLDQTRPANCAPKSAGNRLVIALKHLLEKFLSKLGTKTYSELADTL